ncbi:MAG: hypothetical protein ACYC96_05780 [Fimbriimonadaceae bacterium]
MTIATTFALAVAVIALAGCGTGASKQSQTTYSYVDQDQADAAKKGQTYEDPSKISPQGAVTKAGLAKLQAVVTAVKASMNANPTPATRKAFVNSTVDLGMATMYSADLDRHQKYATALRLFRSALAVDPTNADAKAAADTIVSIYHQMGRPVPK